MKRMCIYLIILIFTVPAFSQDAVKDEKKADAAKKTYQKVYTEMIIEDFETSEYSEKNLKYTTTNEQKGSIQIRDQYPAPFNNSKKYLGVKVYGRAGDTYKIYPAKPFAITKYAKSISMWIYGKRFAGELTLIVQDASNKIHRISFGKISFLGWKKITVKLNKRIKQQDEYLSQEKSLKILHIQYRPGNRTIHPKMQYFYIDEISATVRDKYKDRQGDDW